MRDDLIEAGYKSLSKMAGSGYEWKGDLTRSMINVLLDAIEPLIRADEREHGAHTRQEGWLNTESHRKVVLADLRDRIEADPSPDEDANGTYADGWGDAVDRVLSLLDGEEGSHE